MRGATLWSSLEITEKCYFNPRAPCGARRILNSMFDHPQRFQSTRPVRGATGTLLRTDTDGNISIHAPHAGRDLNLSSLMPAQFNFNPRAPCGARHPAPRSAAPPAPISIHAPHAGRDQHVGQHHEQEAEISIHAPHAGRDGARSACVMAFSHFNPRAPCGARPATPSEKPPSNGFQSTRPMRGATGSCGAYNHGNTISIHAPHAGRDHAGLGRRGHLQ